MKVKVHIPQVKKLRLSRRKAVKPERPGIHAVKDTTKAGMPIRRPAFLSTILRVAASPRKRTAAKKAEHARMLDAEAHKRRQAILKQHRQTVPAMSAAVVSRPLAADAPAIAKPAQPVALTIKHRQPASKPQPQAQPQRVAHTMPVKLKPLAPKPTIPKTSLAKISSTPAQQPQPTPAPPTQPRGRAIDTVQARRYPAGHVQRRIVQPPISRTLSLDGMRG